MPFAIHSCLTDDLHVGLRESLARMLADCYGRNHRADPMDAAAPAHEVVWQRLYRFFLNLPAGQPIGVVCVAGDDGRQIPVATASIARSDRPLPVGATVGDPTSPLPTHRFWCGFHYPTVSGTFDPSLLESAMGEFTRLGAVDLAWLRPHIARGVLTRAEALIATRHGAFAAIAAAYRRDRALSAPSRAFVFDTRAQVAEVFAERYAFPILPLFTEGVAPRPEVVADPLHARTLQRWLAALAPFVPTEVLARGFAAAIRHLVETEFTGWSRLPLRLPWLLPDGDQTVAGMRRLAALLPQEPGEALAQVAAD